MDPDVATHIGHSQPATIFKAFNEEQKKLSNFTIFLDNKHVFLMIKIYKPFQIITTEDAIMPKLNT